MTLDTTPKKRKQEVDERKDSLADSAVDVKTPAAEPEFEETQVRGSDALQSFQSQPDRKESLASAADSTTSNKQSKTPSPNHTTEAVSFSPRRPSISDISEISEEGQESINNGPTKVIAPTNQVGQTESTTTIIESSDKPSTHIEDSSQPLESQQPQYSLEPSPKTRAHEPQIQVLPENNVTDISHAVSTEEETPVVAKSTSVPQLPQPQNLSLTPSGEEVGIAPTEAAHIKTHIAAAEPGPLSGEPDSGTFPKPAPTEERTSSLRKQSPLKRTRSATPTSPETEVPVKRRTGRPPKESQKPSLIARLPIKKGYVLTEDMAPVRDPQDVSGSMKEVIQNMFDVQQTVHGFVPESQEILIDRVSELTQNLAHLQSITNPHTSPNNPVHNIHVAPEIVDYVDDGRNPDIFTREFVELVQRGNAVMNGKKQAFSSFAEIFARELKKGIGGIDKHVDAVMENAGIEVKQEKQEQKGQVNGEKIG